MTTPESAAEPPEASADEETDERVDSFELMLAGIPLLLGRGLHWVSDTSDQRVWAWIGNGFFVLALLVLVFTVVQAVRKGVRWGDLAGFAATGVVVIAGLALLDWLGWY